MLVLIVITYFRHIIAKIIKSITEINIMFRKIK